MDKKCSDCNTNIKTIYINSRGHQVCKQCSNKNRSFLNDYKIENGKLKEYTILDKMDFQSILVELATNIFRLDKLPQSTQSSKFAALVKQSKRLMTQYDITELEFIQGVAYTYLVKKADVKKANYRFGLIPYTIEESRKFVNREQTELKRQAEKALSNYEQETLVIKAKTTKVDKTKKLESEEWL